MDLACSALEASTASTTGVVSSGRSDARARESRRHVRLSRLAVDWAICRTRGMRWVKTHSC